MCQTDSTYDIIRGVMNTSLLPKLAEIGLGQRMEMQRERPTNLRDINRCLLT